MESNDVSIFHTYKIFKNLKKNSQSFFRETDHLCFHSSGKRIPWKAETSEYS